MTATPTLNALVPWSVLAPAPGVTTTAAACSQACIKPSDVKLFRIFLFRISESLVDRIKIETSVQCVSHLALDLG